MAHSWSTTRSPIASDKQWLDRIQRRLNKQSGAAFRERRLQRECLETLAQAMTDYGVSVGAAQRWIEGGEEE